MINWTTPFKGIKYGKWYSNLIAKAKLRGWTKKSAPIAVERHHIVPRSCGGSNIKENLVFLSLREHYVAHALLWKMKFDGVNNMKMVHAFNVMNITRSSKQSKINSRLFEQVKLERIAHLKTLRGTLSKSYGKKYPPRSEETRAKIREMWASPGFKEVMSIKHKEFMQTEKGMQLRKATSERQKGTTRSKEAIEKTAAAKRGKTWEELYTTEQIARMTLANRNKVYTEKGKLAQIENSRKVGQRPKSENFKKMVSKRMTGIKRETMICQHCGIECVRANHTRWHGDNCKLNISR